MKENNINNAANNNSNNEGGFIMTTGTMEIEVFAQTVRDALSVYFEDCTVELQDVTKNNGRIYHGICICEAGSNIAPAIYLDELFSDYRKGRDFVEIVKTVSKIYEENRVPGCFRFDVGMITDYGRVKDKICLRVVNTDRNRKLLSDVPHVPFCDLAVIFHVKLPGLQGQEASVTIRNGLMDSWGVDVDTLYQVAKYNTPRLLPGNVRSMESVLSEIFCDEPGDFLMSGYDGVNPADGFAMYVATNRARLNGAAVFLYDSLLSGFAERIGADFYIIPSSIHELIFLPKIPFLDAGSIREMVLSVNATEVLPEEVLSDNVYHYNRATGLVEIA